MVKSRRLAWVAWVAVCIFWGTTFPAIRIMVRELPPLLMAGMRQTTAGACLIALCLALRLRFPRGREWLDMLVAGLLLVGISNGMAAWSLRRVGGGLATLMVASSAFWMVGLEALRPGGDKPNWKEMAGLVAGFVGLVILVSPLNLSDWRYALSLLALQGVSVCNALGFVYLRERRPRLDALVSAAFQLFMGGGLLALYAVAIGEHFEVSVSPESYLAFAYLVVFGSLVGYVAYVYMLPRLPASVVSLYVYMNPLVAVIVSWAFMHEPVTLRFWIGGAIILAGVGFVQNSIARKSAVAL